VAMSPWHHELQQIGDLQGRLNGFLAILIGLTAAVVVLLPALWEVSQHVNTMAHEGGHALMCVLIGQKLDSVKMKLDGTGATSPSKNEKYSRTVGVIGYLAPGLLGLGAAKLIEMRHIVDVLWLFLLGLLLLLVVARGWFAPICVLATGFLLYLIVRYGSVGLQVVVAYGMTWFLLFSGFTMVIKHNRNAGDAGNLRKATHVPESLWVLIWLIGSTFTMILGAVLLV